MLTAAERARLRPEIDVGALELLLQAAPAELRPLILATCVRDLTNADLVAAGFDPIDDGMLPVTSLDFQFDDAHLKRLWKAAQGHRDIA